MAKMKELEFAEAEKIKLTKEAKSKIRSMYIKLAKEANQRASMLPKDGSISESVRKQYLYDHAKELQKSAEKLIPLQENIITDTSKRSAALIVDANNEFMARAGLELKGAFSYVPEDVIERLITGKAYEEKWSLSKAIWKSNKKTRYDIMEVVAKGLADNKPTLGIAKDLEKYVDPTALKAWEWKKVYPSTSTKVDYNSQRIARTLIQHSYQLSLRDTTKYNPFVEGIIWHSVFAHGRTCQLCKDRDGTTYAKGKEPLDHPQGLCYFEAAIPDSMTDIADRLANWAHGAKDADIDIYVNKALR